MKKFLFYLSNVIIIILIWFCLSAVLACIDRNHPLGFAYAMGGWFGRPYVLLAAIGIGLFFRKLLYSAIYKKSKKYSNRLAILITLAGMLSIAANIFLSYQEEVALQKFIKSSQEEHLEDSY